MDLKKKEFMLIVDSTNGLALIEVSSNPTGIASMTIKSQILTNVIESIEFDKLAEKWEVNAQELLAKMENADESEYKQLWKQIEEFWIKNDQSNREKL